MSNVIPGVVAVTVLAAAAFTVPALTQDQKPASPATKDVHVTEMKGSAHDNEGQRIFEANCSRCHATPEGFSPSISATVVRHMRVRASLSAHDERELLKFFNP